MSWVIVEKKTQKAIFETYSKKVADAINKTKYEALPARKYLEQLNKRIKESK